MHDPRGLAGVEEAVQRLVQARDARQKIALVGDYDVDGVSGTAILTAVLRHCKIRVHPILPHRLHDGYGFQPIHVDKAQGLGCSMIVTVDCGTTSLAAARQATEAGLQVIVTDHHLPGEALPDGVIQINPKQAGNTYPFIDLCGAGLAFKLALALADACGRPLEPRVLLRIACLGTIADLVPLRGENRVIAALGLKELENTRSVGLKSLIRVARLRTPYSTDDIGFRIGPRLNAPGRLDSAEASLELLLTRDRRRAEEMADKLDGWNRERQDWERKVSAQAQAYFEERLQSGDLPAILVAWNKDWHRGVVGIAAGRLARTYNRPTILLASDGEQATGSGRSIPQLHLYDFLARWKSELPRFGGHAQAIGMTVPLDQLEGLRQRWEEKAAEEWTKIVAVKTFKYELALDAREVTWPLFQDLRRLEPHGQENSQPLIRIRGPLHLERAPRVFGKGNISATAIDPTGGKIRLLGWGWEEKAEVLLQGNFEMLGYLEYDRYRGGCQLRLLDVRPSE